MHLVVYSEMVQTSANRTTEVITRTQTSEKAKQSNLCLAFKNNKKNWSLICSNCYKHIDLNTFLNVQN